MKKVITNYFKTTVLWMIFISSIQMVSSLLSIAMPLSYQYLIDTILMQEQYGRLSAYAFFVLIAFGGYLLLNFLSQRMIIVYMNRLEGRMKEALFDKIIYSESSYINYMSKGQIITRISTDVNTIVTNLSEYLFSSFISLFSYIVIMIIIFRMNVILGVLNLIFTPSYFILSHVFGNVIKKYSIMLKRDGEQFLDVVDESIQGRETIRVYACQEYQKERFTTQLLNYMQHKKELMVTHVLSKQSFQGLSILFPVIMLLVGAQLIINNQLTLGVLISVLSCMNYVLAPSTTLSRGLIAIKEYKVAYGRLKEFYDCKEEHYEKKEEDNQEEERGYISVRKVHVRFPNQDVLKDISFDLNKHDVISIVGTNGVGKSTLAKVLSGLIIPTHGQVVVDENILDESTLSEVRNKVSVALQESFIFSDTVYNNIYLGGNGEENPLIETLIKEIGYDKNIQRGQLNLSGGEIQRIIMARALAKNGDILIIDETISNIDMPTHQEIRKIIEQYKGKKTILIIDHQLNFIDLCDKVLFLEKGDKVSISTHEKLTEENEQYRVLSKAQ